MENDLSLQKLGRVDIIATLAARLADLLRDPTDGGKRALAVAAKTTDADKRAAARDDIHCDLMTCIDTLVANAQYNAGVFDVLSIVEKYRDDKPAESKK